MRRSYVKLSCGITPLFPEEMLHGVIIVGVMCILIGSFFTIVTKELEILNVTMIFRPSNMNESFQGRSISQRKQPDKSYIEKKNKSTARC